MTIHELSAAGLARRIRDGELSPVTAVEAILERIEERNDRTNAFVTIADKAAREAAARAEQQLENGRPVGPLHGVPVAIKDLEPVAGIPTTYGSQLFADYVPESDAVFVERLKAAGAIVVGKTNTPEFGLGCTTDNLVAGPTGSPFAPDRVSGGSSGGAGAALGERLVPLAQGSDTGGSVRIPAAFCGVYGLKPSFGRIPRANRPDAFADHTPFSHLGPMARRVEDAALMLDVMAGPHPRDPFSLPAANESFRSATARGIDGLQIAVSPGFGIYPVAPAVRDEITAAADTFAAAGAAVDHVDPDFELTNTEVLEAFYTFAKVHWEALFDGLETEYGLDPRGEDRGKLRPITVETILESAPVSTREYKQADQVRTRVFDGLQDVFRQYDLLVSATTAVLPFPHGEYPSGVAGESIEELRGWVLTQPYNFSGHPAASIPAGMVDGLPVGLQIAGRRHADADVLAASAAFERRRPWHDRYPA